jgi:hypothetical protein
MAAKLRMMKSTIFTLRRKAPLNTANRLHRQNSTATYTDDFITPSSGREEGKTQL